MEMKKSAREIFWNALLLTGAALLIRTVSVAFGVYISGVAGSEAMGLFSLMAGVYGFALTLATSGIQFGVTRLLADALGRGARSRIRQIMRAATLYALFFGLLAAMGLYTLSAPIGRYWLKDLRTVRPLRLFGLTLPLIALSSAWNGYFTAMRRVWKNAATQVLEQAVKILATVLLLSRARDGGIEALCTALVLGGALAETVSALLSFLLFLIDRLCEQKRGQEVSPLVQTPRPAALPALLSITLPMAVTAYLRSGLLTLQHILIPEGLRRGGSSHALALSAYGCIHSMALPVLLYPAALIASFASLLVPALAECAVGGSQKRIRYMISRVWSLSLLFSIGVAGILLFFSASLGETLYPGTRAGYYIRLLAPLIPIMYVDTATDAMMKGLGEQIYSMGVNIADAAISVGLVWLLIPRMGIAGYLLTIYISETFNTVMSVAHLLRISRAPVRLFQWICKPLLSIVGATALCRLLFCLLPLPSGATGLVLSVCLSALLYLLLLLVTGAVEKEDMEWVGTLFTKAK